jgi:hypothetical protein
MNRRNVELHVSDHAVLRYLQHRHGIDTEAVRRHLSGLTINAAELGAVAVRAEDVRFFLRSADIDNSHSHVTVTTVRPREMVHGLGRSPSEVGDG